MCFFFNKTTENIHLSFGPSNSAFRKIQMKIDSIFSVYTQKQTSNILKQRIGEIYEVSP